MSHFLFIFILFSQILMMSRAESAESRKVFAYITSTGSDTVSIVDTENNTIVKAITVGNNPKAAAVTPNGKKVYIANRGAMAMPGNTISIINTERLMDSPLTITVGMFPEGIAIRPDGKKAYVTNAGSNTVSVIDTANDNGVITTIPVGVRPDGIAITPNGKRVYVANDGPDNISVISTSGDTENKVIDTIQLPTATSPAGIAITPDGKKAYVANTGRDNISVIDVDENSPNQNKVIKTIDLLTRSLSALGVAVSPDGKKVYVTNPAAPGTTIAVISTETDEFVTTIQVGTNPEGVAFTPDGQFAYVTNRTSSTVSVIDVATNQVVKTIDGFNDPQTFGNFITPLPIVKFSTSEVTFPSQGSNPSTGTQTITLTNSGNGILEISNIVISGNFSQTNNCGSSLTAYASCTITVTLLKTDGSIQSGNLTVTTNASDAPTTIPVRGSVTPPSVGAGGCDLTQSENFKMGYLLFLMNIGFVFLIRKKI